MWYEYEIRSLIYLRYLHQFGSVFSLLINFQIVHIKISTVAFLPRSKFISRIKYFYIFVFLKTFLNIRATCATSRLCSHFADMFCYEIFMLCNDLSNQPAECSGMKCLHVIEMRSFR